MYETLKKILKKIVPESIIRKNEKLLRKFVALTRKGNNYECNICKFQMSHFIILENGNQLCPKCGSLPRTRRLWQILEPNIEGKEILHFSPSTALSTKIEETKTKNYVTTDYEDEFVADEKYDIQDIAVADNSFDIVICFHVLEHIPDDKKAMGEIKRVLKPGGVCYIQTPFKKGDIYEDDRINTPEARLKHFGQADHLRVYSAIGLKSRLQEAGFGVKIKKFSEIKDNRFGFKESEIILIAKCI